MLMPSAGARLRLALLVGSVSLIGCGGSTEPVEPIKAEPGKTRSELTSGPANKKAGAQDSRINPRGPE